MAYSKTNLCNGEVPKITAKIKLKLVLVFINSALPTAKSILSSVASAQVSAAWKPTYSTSVQFVPYPS